MRNRGLGISLLSSCGSCGSPILLLRRLGLAGGLFDSICSMNFDARPSLLYFMEGTVSLPSSRGRGRCRVKSDVCLEQGSWDELGDEECDVLEEGGFELQFRDEEDGVVEVGKLETE